MKIRRSFSGLLGGLAVALWPQGGVLATESEPLSAIGWLSDSLDLPAEPAPQTPEIPIAALPGDITVRPLGAALPDQAGLQPATTLGIDPGLWGRSSAGDLARSLANVPTGEDGPPTLVRLL